MSTAVYFANHNIPAEDVHNKHTLPSLAQIMPPVQQQQAQQQTQQGSLIYATQQQPQQQSPDVFSHTSQISSMHTTPASLFSAEGQNYIAAPQGHMPLGTSSAPGSISGASSGSISEKCTCKSNANRIPRPRNAFILFRQKYHQSVLDEGSEIRTNPEVSRELGRRWRALSADEKEHWNNLAEEEKKNHAKKYPGYRYTPRRHGKNKGCPACLQKALRQQQAQLHNQQMLQLQQDLYQQYLQIQQQQQQQQQQPQQPQQQQPQQVMAPAITVPQQMNVPMPQGANFMPQNMSQFVVQNPFQQQNFQHAFSNMGSVEHGQFHQDKLSPLSVAPTNPLPGQPGVGMGPNNEFLAPMAGNAQFAISYDQQPQQPQQSHYHHQLRFNSLPTPLSNSGGYGFDMFNMQQQGQ